MILQATNMPLALYFMVANGALSLRQDWYYPTLRGLKNVLEEIDAKTGQRSVYLIHNTNELKLHFFLSTMPTYGD